MKFYLTFFKSFLVLRQVIYLCCVILKCHLSPIFSLSGLIKGNSLRLDGNFVRCKTLCLLIRPDMKQRLIKGRGHLFSIQFSSVIPTNGNSPPWSYSSVPRL
jgi:hypothetical protein